MKKQNDHEITCNIFSSRCSSKKWRSARNFSSGRDKTSIPETPAGACNSVGPTAMSPCGATDRPARVAGRRRRHARRARGCATRRRWARRRRARSTTRARSTRRYRTTTCLPTTVSAPTHTHTHGCIHTTTQNTLHIYTLCYYTTSNFNDTQTYLLAHTVSTNKRSLRHILYTLVRVICRVVPFCITWLTHRV